MSPPCAYLELGGRGGGGSGDRRGGVGARRGANWNSVV